MPAEDTTAVPFLEVTGLDVAYGSLQVLFETELHVEQGEVLALLGTNGAGKSTLLRAVAGLIPPRQGEIRLEGESLGDLGVEARVRRGIGLVAGGNAVFRSLSVAENLTAAAYALPRPVRRARIDAAVDRFPTLRRMRHRTAGALSGGEQQMLAIAKALVLDPRLLLIDELSLGLAPIVVAQLMEVVAELAEAGTTMVVVEQSIEVALHLARRAVFMEKGRVLFSGDAQELAARDDIARAVFLGAAR